MLNIAIIPSNTLGREEADEYIRIGTLNGLFVLGRSIGFIGHYLDQKRLKQGYMNVL
jgi:ATP citrate (pro-S)-lyase